ncbi:MAG: hypothetical protein RMJ98_01390 [Myxococcales bacterium]|nr:hypothetical protein [Polyangiaceae bacterium]MDW8247941.1 hypothetical protein [Myxococcales bacterium]
MRTSYRVVGTLAFFLLVVALLFLLGASPRTIPLNSSREVPPEEDEERTMHQPPHTARMHGETLGGHTRELPGVTGQQTHPKVVRALAGGSPGSGREDSVGIGGVGSSRVSRQGDEPSVDEQEQADIEEHERLHGQEGVWQAPLTWGCKGERIYRAEKLSFSAPTPAKLARTLEDITQGGIALVLRLREGVWQVALSAIASGQSGGDPFPSGMSPPFLRLVDGFGVPPGVSSERFQPYGFLRVVEPGGFKWLSLRQLNWRAVEQGGCERVQVEAFASLPSSQWGTVLHRGTHSLMIQELLDLELTTPPDEPAGGGLPHPSEPLPIPLHFTFFAVAITPHPPR